MSATYQNIDLVGASFNHKVPGITASARIVRVMAAIINAMLFLASRLSGAYRARCVAPRRAMRLDNPARNSPRIVFSCWLGLNGEIEQKKMHNINSY